MNIRKVVVPVAGWGTRSLPASKNIPKEMLPIYNKPVVQYVVEEAMLAGVQDVIFVTNRDKSVIEDFFDYNPQLESILERSGKYELLKVIQNVAEMVNIMSVRQKRQLGLGHAVLCAKEIVRDEPFAVMVGDDLMFGENAGMDRLIQIAREQNKPVIGVREVPEDKINRYGIISGTEISTDVYDITEMIEKPTLGSTQSRLAIVGRYLLTPDIFEYLEKVTPGHGGEIQLTDALAALAQEKGMLAVKLGGLRFDAGDWVDYLSANVYFAMMDETLKDDLFNKLNQILHISEKQ
ncbi:UTP--glucose-1-phosphate uridylyltransferase GalU [Lawsonia intracellularis]|nr:UTP--glucose-1-phosphate uridylyltransferase GalU [Lawsonia intracellularis]AGC49597.1 UTP-glucose-1-phosphate uridylyltransferase [Lawsonia intracellularis N343]KAA0205103.1 UTP--glucose-1-phosphate uridylyltransferase [Lawsonia intracellularis]MBZ3892371.1 UTP--glucose-1-phosphate uridylyltransferase GalU [Lawsonia intracellularis]RBN32350.1 UTP--glucose-1-phosphate uridylyltransferase [Lawsonia intracellularis]RBN33916.1 UTP--glucose-1-phosphate uridylyltransferase [Lawsonia intracellula